MGTVVLTCEEEEGEGGVFNCDKEQGMGRL